jgi:hypothetical protein
MTHYADRETQRKLIDACNLLCDHIAKKLPEGWSICLTIENGEATASLFEPGGGEVEFHGSDSGISSFDDMCVTAIEWKGN